MTSQSFTRRSVVVSAAAAALAVGARSAFAADDVVIGAPNSLTGGFGEAGRRVVIGLEIAVNEVNRGGGIKALEGAKLRMVAADTTSDNPAQASSVTRRMIVQDGAIVLVGCHTSTMTLAAQIEAEKGEVPIITTSYADQIVTRGYKYTFKIPPESSRFQLSSMQYLKDLFKSARGTDLQKIGVFYGTDSSSQVQGKTMLTQGPQAGLQIVAQGSFPSGLTDPTPVVAPVLQTKPELIFLNSYTNDVILIVRALRSLGYTGPVVTSGGGISTHVIGESLGKDANGLVGTVAWNWDLQIPGMENFLKLLKQDKPDEPFPPMFEAIGQGYAIGHLIAASLEKAASRDPKKVRDAIAGIEVPSILPGAKIGFDEKGLNKYLEPILVGWVDGQLRTLWPQKYQTTKPPI